MDMKTLGRMLGWCLLINFAILMLWFVMLTAAHDWVYSLHARWFAISENQFDLLMYGAMAFYKIGVILLNGVPYIALRIVTRKAE
jgi:hypothetical protein